MAKSLTLRLDEEMARELEMVARVRGTSVAHAIRLAVARYLAGLSSDEEFQVRLDEVMAREHEIVARYGAGG